VRQLCDPEDVKELGTIMGVWAHPDDETFTSGGLMALAASYGQQVICVTATKGEQGIHDHTRWPAEKLGNIRAQELLDALQILGVTTQHWLAYRDGECDQVTVEKAAAEIVQCIKKYKPDTILTFGPDGSTGHPDHIAVGEWVVAACQTMDNPPKVYFVADTKEHYTEPFKRIDKSINYYFNLPKPHLVAKDSCDICINLPSDICKIKCDALQVQQSQTDQLFTRFSRTELEKGFAIESFVLADKN
jgi:LmbE family N-acetylglucosaminyl deacetylase